jgi:hypothetical protein
MPITSAVTRIPFWDRESGRKGTKKISPNRMPERIISINAIQMSSFLFKAKFSLHSC